MAWSSPRTWSTSEVVTAAHMNQEVRDNLDFVLPDDAASVDWDPALEATVDDPSVSVDGARYRVGALEFLWARFTFSAVATPYGDGIYFVTLPNAATSNIPSSTTFGTGTAVGTWQARDDSVPTGLSGAVLLRSSTEICFNGPTSGLLNSGGPWIWASGDILSFHCVIPTA